MKRPVFLALLCASAGSNPALAQIIAPAPRPSISVTGTAEIRVAPDEVNVRLGVETRDLKLDEAVNQNENRTTAILKFLKEAGIEAKDVQTDFVEIHPQYDPNRGQQITPDYYLVRRNTSIRLRKVSQFDAVLNGALKSGANHVENIEFRTTELRKHRDTARQQAIRAAKEKATALASELDAKIGKPQNIQEETSGGYWGWSGANWRQSNPMFQNTTQSAPASESSDGNLAVGQISITATVHVTFALD